MSIYFFILLFVVSTYFSKRQERRHFIERSVFYTNEELYALKLKPKKDMLESVLMLFVGIFTLEGSGLFLWTYISIMNSDGIQMVKDTQQTTALPMLILMLGGSIAILSLAVKSLYDNIRFQRGRRV